MIISSKGRYALRVMIDLAEHSGSGYTAMKEVAERNDISLKYLERILPVLVSNGLIEGVHGKGGGYRLSKDPADISVGEVLRLTEGGLAPVSCLEEGAEPCSLACECRTAPMWNELADVINGFLDKKTLKDLMKTQ
ncbi:MAG: RrF2 family transcriptional regulator [Clostridia bacterium]|nr:RrF2 family transcriptional regulator [Clostridia bacterium]